MKRALLMLGCILAASSQAYAGNGYCDSRQSNLEVQRCYKNGIEIHAAQIKKNYQRLMQSPKLSSQQKQQLQRSQDQWVEKVERYCGNDIRCISDAAVERNSYLYLQANKL